MFKNLESLIKKEYTIKRAEVSHYINYGYFRHWSEEHRKNSDAGLKAYSTPAKWELYTSGKISREKAVDIAIKRARKQFDKKEAAKLERLKAVELAPDVRYCDIVVEWVRNSYWGANPRAEVTVNDSRKTFGKASGCGYDKLSAAVAEALNQNNSILKMLYTAAEKALKEGQTPKRCENGNYTYRDILGYGSGYDILPYFEGGVGISCFQSIFNTCGYKFKSVASSKNFDAYTASKGA